MNDSTSVYLRVAVPLALNEGTLTYRLDQSHLPEALAALDCAGCRVHVAVRRRPLIGLVMQVLSEPDIDAARVQPIEGLIDSVPVVNRETLSFLEDVARYYRQPIGQITHMSLPRDSLTFTAAWSARASTSTTTRESRTLFTVHDHILELLAQADEPMDVHAIRDALAATAPTDKKRVILKSVREALDQLGANGRVEKHRVCKTRLSVPHPAIATASHAHAPTSATAAPPAHPSQQTPPPAPPAPPSPQNGRGQPSAEVIGGDAIQTAPPAPPMPQNGRGQPSAEVIGGDAGQTAPPAPPMPQNGRVRLSVAAIDGDAVQIAADASSFGVTSSTAPEATLSAASGTTPNAISDATSSAVSDVSSSDTLAVGSGRLPVARVQTPAYRLSDDQRGVAHAIMKALDQFGVHVMHGVTGSGKTDV
ncbi:MAG: hypothetical protein K8963_06560, partial [Proteobacteria bacterium]|nr:hypothetical protein [Pseudomonadota bacterium]